jgi:hypothetical protein
MCNLKWRACTYISMHAPAGATVLGGVQRVGPLSTSYLAVAPECPCPARTPPIPGYGGVGQWRRRLQFQVCLAASDLESFPAVAPAGRVFSL